jgi:hypothetical protein
MHAVGPDDFHVLFDIHLLSFRQKGPRLGALSCSRTSLWRLHPVLREQRAGRGFVPAHTFRGQELNNA